MKQEQGTPGGGDRRWRSINGEQDLSPIVPEAFDFRKFIREPRIIASFVVALLGIAVAGLSTYIPNDTLRTMGYIVGACLSFGGAGQINSYINKRTAYEAQQNPPQKKKR